MSDCVTFIMKIYFLFVAFVIALSEDISVVSLLKFIIIYLAVQMILDEYLHGNIIKD